MISIFADYTTVDYQIIFKWIIGFFIVFGSLVLKLKQQNKQAYRRNDHLLLLLLVIILTLFFGLRSIKVGTDTWNYYHFYYVIGIQINGFAEFFKYFNTDLFFEVVMFLTFPFKNFNFFLIVVAAIININLYLFSRKFTEYGHKGSSLLLYLMICCGFSFLSLQLNIIRNGLSISFIHLALYFFLKRDHRKGFLLIIIGYLFHSTALIPFLAILLSIGFYEKVKLKYFLAAYVLAIGLAMVGFGFNSIPFLSLIESDDFQRLTFQGETSYGTGFRLDFVAYNTFFLFLFLKFKKSQNRYDEILIRYFIITSIVFFFNFNIPFSDRVGVYSWIAIPVLFYSIINNSFPRKRLFIITRAVIFYFIINQVILYYLLQN